jgi:hypothetical protein
MTQESIRSETPYSVVGYEFSRIYWDHFMSQFPETFKGECKMQSTNPWSTTTPILFEVSLNGHRHSCDLKCKEDARRHGLIEDMQTSLKHWLCNVYLKKTAG